jgi:hypothetical protein
LRATGTTADTNSVGQDVPDLTLIERRDGNFRAVHVAHHVENPGRKPPMPRWPRVFAHQYTVPPQLQVYKVVRYLDSIQRVNEWSELMDSPVPYP